MPNERGSPPRGALGQFRATAICGNDITSSCLYVSSLAILHAGKLAPLVLIIVAAVLFLFRSIYAEVVGALPLNGGAYNALLNTTSKYRASIAACLTILSYMATAVISASEAMHYFHALWPAVSVQEATIGLLAVFMGLTILGITESAAVAVGIFVLHLATLAILLVAGTAYVFTHDTAVLAANFNQPVPGGVPTALFFGFSAAMLGISGFESSANFVEEQAPGVFPKTLRNMWAAVTILNPATALLALLLIPVAETCSHQNALLAHMGGKAAGTWLATLISIDAALVLSGAVLTSFVGVNGLMRRMTLDRCLPQFLAKQNRRGTTHRIIITFFALCVSVLFITRGELEALAGVYTISFLSVMALFAVGNILLKVKRARLSRPTRASVPAVLVAVAAVSVGLVGNVEMNPPYFGVFLEYFVPSVLIVSLMLGRITLLKACLFMLRSISGALVRRIGWLSRVIRSGIERINAQQIVFFTRGDNVANLNNAILYIRKNEHTSRVKVVIVARDPSEVPERLKQDLRFLNEAYPDLDIEFVVVDGTFGPELIQALSARWRIPTNLMFIGSPGQGFRYGLAELGGVRLII